jgi:glycosyltransferase involved in cell wall biosynthesis
MKVLFIEPCNFIDYPLGGQLTFAKQLVSVLLPSEVDLCGITTNNTKKGWQEMSFNGNSYNYYNLYETKAKRKHIIPLRLKTAFYIKKEYKHLNLGKYDVIFISAPEVLFGLRKSHLNNVIYYFPGIKNALVNSRRLYARLLSKVWDFIFINKLKYTRKIIAAADKSAINAFIGEHNCLNKFKIEIFSTRFDNTIFFYRERDQVRELLKLPKEKIIILFYGRLSNAKGWQLLLDSFMLFSKEYKNGCFYMIGDGEAYENIKEQIITKELSNYVFLLGRQSQETIAKFISASNLVVMGSYVEGWSTTLIEAKACGIPICSTNFSSAKDIVSPNEGIIVDERNNEVFANAMKKSMRIKIDKDKISDSVKQYSLGTLREDFFRIISR